MTLQASGPLNLQDIADEFEGTVPHSLSEYYSADTGVPSSGEISMSDFYGKSNFTFSLLHFPVGVYDFPSPESFAGYLKTATGTLLPNLHDGGTEIFTLGVNDSFVFFYNMVGSAQIGSITEMEIEYPFHSTFNATWDGRYSIKSSMSSLFSYLVGEESNTLVVNITEL